MQSKPALSVETRERIDAFCKQISVAHDLDTDIQRELRAHMEDKLLAYLSGEELVTEADAWILVREHFGDPGVLKALLREVHGREARVTFFRRFAAACAAFLAMRIALGFADAAVAFWQMWGQTEIVGAPRGAEPIHDLLWCVGAAAFWYALYRWQRRIDLGRRVWAIEWKPITIGLVLCLLAAGAQLTPSVIYRLTEIPAPIVLPNGATSHVARGVMVIHSGGYVGLAAMYAAWLWWWDRPPRSRFALIAGFCTLSVLYLGVPILGSLLPSSNLLLGADGAPQGLLSGQGSIPGTPLMWRVSLEGSASQPPLPEILSTVMRGGLIRYRLHQVTFGFVVCLAYAAFTRTRLRRFLTHA